ncbi:MAG TPA: Flp pilus assembly protein CpaB [Pirellulaceae bacterium]|nr:Flp pilus assembly protein CpaB [Pirellulaceae bacterium]
MKSLILIFIALGCGLVASIGISQVMERGGSSGPGMEMEQILVALADIDNNKKLDATNVRLEDWPKAKVPEGAIRRLDDAKDKFTATRFYKGEPILISKLADQASGVAQYIPEGYRAEPVKVEEDTVMKAISPGDRVDVSVFLKKDGREIPVTGVFPILRNVQIFAVNSNTERTVDAKGGEAAFRTVSLLVKEKQIAELQLAKQMGRIQLSLRRPNEPDDGLGEEVLKMSELMAGRSQLGGDPTPAPAPQQSAGLSQFLSSGAQGSSSGSGSEWKLDIMTPGGIEQYNWAKRDGLPQKSGAFAGDTSTLVPTPTSAPAQSAPSQSNTPADGSAESTTERPSDNGSALSLE